MKETADQCRGEADCRDGLAYCEGRGWPHTHLTIRGDGHYSRPEVMAWCEENGLDFVFGLPGNAILAGAVEEAADDIRTRRALDQKPALRGFAETRYQAKSWKRERRACARIEATTKGLDIRFVVTSLHTGSAEHVYETLYCARGQAENLIKLHKAQLASDRTSYRSPLANQMRLILHTAAYWLMLTVRDAIPKAHAPARSGSRLCIEIIWPRSLRHWWRMRPWR